MSATTADIMIFLDDDCAVVSPDLIAQVQQRFSEQPQLGVVGFRIQVAGESRSLSRWTPRGKLDADSGLVSAVAFPGGGHAIRRAAYQDAGGYCNEFFFKHEETQLSWRLLDHGWDVLRDDAMIVEHPETAETRHQDAFRIGCRNRLWLARMALPRGLVSVGMVIAIARHLARCRSTGELSQVIAGIQSGLEPLPHPRKPLQWQTIRELTQRGRCPVL